jgi:hypothetical protein
MLNRDGVLANNILVFSRRAWRDAAVSADPEHITASRALPWIVGHIWELERDGYTGDLVMLDGLPRRYAYSD